MAPGLGIHRIRGPFRQFVGLLDQPFATGATAAYSLRKLKSSATKAVRVREDSGNTETDIGFSGGTLDTTALLNHCGSNNGFVTKWYDQSGNGNDASNSIASEQPQIVSSGSVIKENGKPAIEFDANDDSLKTDDSSIWSIIELGRQFEWFFVLSKEEKEGSIIAKGNEFSLDFVDRNSSNSKVAGRFGYFGDNTESANYNDEIPANTQLLIDFFGEGGVGTQLDYNNNNYFDHSSTTTTSNRGNAFVISKSKKANAGKIQEIIYYNSKKSSDRSKIKTDLDNFYNIPNF